MGTAALEPSGPRQDAKVIGRHHKTGEETTVHQRDLDDLGLRLGIHAAVGYGYWIFAMQGLIAAPDDPWMAVQHDGAAMVQSRTIVQDGPSNRTVGEHPEQSKILRCTTLVIFASPTLGRTAFIRP
jgi:hypothetical protein